MDNTLNVALAALDPFHTLMSKIWAKTPSVFAALILLLIGSLVGRWSRYVAENALKLTKIDEYSKTVGMNDVLGKLGLPAAPSRIIGVLAYWFVFLSFLLSAANVVQLTIVSEFLQQVVLFMPKLVAAVIVLGGGFLLARISSQVVANALRNNRMEGVRAVSRVTYGTLVVFASLMAIQCLGIDASIIANSVQIVVAAIGLGFAIAFGVAFGLAGKDYASAWLREKTTNGRGQAKDGYRKAA